MRQATDLKLRSEQSIETATPSTDFDQRHPPAPWGSRLLWSAEKHRLLAAQQVDPGRRATLGQFLTPPPVASFLASLFDLVPGPGNLLDPGAGIGSLSAAFADRWLREAAEPLSVTAVEIDDHYTSPLRETLDDLEMAGVRTDLVKGDFTQWAFERAASVQGSLLAQPFNYVVMNPPYRKVNTDSPERNRLMATGVEVTNLYTAFLALGARLLGPGGQLVAITPRSFANGPYFLAFRRDFLSQMSFRRIHVYDARDDAFSDSEVLQENVVIHAVKRSPSKSVTITSSAGADDEMMTLREAGYEEVVSGDDPQLFIHLSTDEIGASVTRRMHRLQSSLADIGVSVSTGRVVQFRAREHLRETPAPGTAPLIFPGHFSSQGGVKSPLGNGTKPDAIDMNGQTVNLLLPNGTYVLVKRFSAKEERRRVVATVSAPEAVPGDLIGFENHLNVIHHDGGPIDPVVAKGLAAFLNSTMTDLFFRQWSGHTQVNATDLRRLRYPSTDELRRLGESVGDHALEQRALDQMVARYVPSLRTVNEKVDSVMAHQYVLDAQNVLRQLRLPRPQTNERSALTLLALLGLTPAKEWAEIEAPLMGITPMMDFMRDHYGKQYAPNTRETVRRQTVHQFVAAGIARRNPDDPRRPTNSGQTVYQASSELVDLLRHYGSPQWEDSLAYYLEVAPSLRDRWAREREMDLIPVSLPDGRRVTLAPGGQNPLVKAVVEEFCPRFVVNGHLLYMGDTAAKFAVWERAALRDVGVVVDEHGKMPDLVVLDRASNWLVLIEAVTSHGPMDAKRREELASLFAHSTAGLVYVTAFPDRRTLARYIEVISWETEVWVAETPTHMIHFDGERFLGPFDSK